MKYTIHYLDGKREEYEETEDESTWFNLEAKVPYHYYTIFRDKIFEKHVYMEEDDGDLCIARSLHEINDWDPICKMSDCVNIGEKIYSLGENRYGVYNLEELDLA